MNRAERRRALMVHEQGDHVTVDLHGYETAYAAYEIAPAFITAAWRKGKKQIKLIHGSPDVTSRHLATFRGGTKWALRRELRRGTWDTWVWNHRSVKHSGLAADSGAMTLALRPNPNPEYALLWPSVEEPPHDYDGPWHRGV